MGTGAAVGVGVGDGVGVADFVGLAVALAEDADEGVGPPGAAQPVMATSATATMARPGTMRTCGA